MEILAKHVGERLLSRGWMLVTAESCTGGLVAKIVTDVAGSSAWFDRGFITYSNDSKKQMLGVHESTIEEFGAVSERTVIEMVNGALISSNAQCGIAVSGIAGPAGGTVLKPVGTVCIAWKIQGSDAITETCYFPGDRESVRQQAAIYSLQKIVDLI